MINNSVRVIQRKAFWYPLLGNVCIAACAVFLVTSAAKAVHLLSRRPSANALDDVFIGGFGRIIAYAYQSAAEHAPLTAEFIWKLAPSWTLYSWNPGNGVLGVYLLLLAGVYLRSRGHEYKKLLKVFRERMLLRQLEESERGVRITHDRTAPVVAVDAPSLPWHQGARGTIVLGILLPLIVEFLKVLVGLAKLP